MRILVVSDIHANRTALEAVLDAAGEVDAVWNLGDVVGYGPDPVWCLERLAALPPAVSLAGNHDLVAVGALSITEFNPLAQIATRWTAARLSSTHRAQLMALPVRSSVAGVTFAHGSPSDPVWEYVADSASATANFAHFETRLCFVGHTHVPSAACLGAGGTGATFRPLRSEDTLSVENDRWILNPGSVGQPRDGDPRAAFAIFEPEPARFSVRRVAYDIPAVQQRMRDAGLPTPLIARLARGR